MSKKYYTRYILYPDGSIEEIKVPKREADKQIDEIIKKDKEMLDILKRL